MPDPKHNPLIGVSRAPPEPAPPEAKPPAAPPKAEPAAAGKAAPDKQAPEAPKAPAAPPQAEPAAVGKAAPDKQTPEAPKAPVAPPKAEPATAGKAAPDKQTPEAPKAPTAPPKAEPAAGKPASEKKEPEPPKAPADGTAKAKPDKDAKPAGQANAAKDKKPGDAAKSQDGGASIVSQVPVDEIAENKLFSLDENDPSFKRLVEDIRKNGMREPINVNRTTDGKYEIIDGNRRLRAAKKLGLKTISTTIMNLPDKLKAKGQINSNLETHDLGGPEGDGDKGGDKGPSGPEQPGGGKEAPKPRFVALSHIKPLPGTYIKDEPRKDYSDLIADIKKHGLKKPVILRQSEKEGEFQLVDGFHRCKAMEQAGMLEVRADVYEMTLAQANDYRKGHREKPDLPIPGKLAPYPPEEPAKAQKAPEPPAAEEGEELPRDFQIPLTKEGQPETVTSLPIGVIKPFEGHPFYVKDNKDMWDLVDSVKKFGVLEPVMVIPHKDGGYEMVSGHRRLRACQLAGIERIPVIVRNLDRDEAIISMVDANLKREEISPMEKARAYQMKTDAMKRKLGRRSREEKARDEANGVKPLSADQALAQQVGESAATIQRYKTLNKLVPELQDMVDEGKIPVNTGSDIAQMKPKDQKALADAIKREDKVPTGAQAKELKEESKKGTLTEDTIQKAVAPTKKEADPELKVTFTNEELRSYFPDKKTTVGEVKRVVFEALELRQRALDRKKARAAEKAAPAPAR